MNTKALAIRIIVLFAVFVSTVTVKGEEDMGLAVSKNEEGCPVNIQAGFYTPSRVGEMWDTWIYFHEGQYYMYYLAGSPWSKHELAVSTDGVHWQEYGVMIRPRENTVWMGTGHIWETPDFDTSEKWIMNYSEWVGDKQDIMFATSTDLVNWTKVDESLRFVQDTRWYRPRGRWDCIDALRRADGEYYGYFTADPDPEKVEYPHCGFGFAESKDGLNWTALPPPGGDMTGEFGGIQRIGDKYYILISEGRCGVGDKPEGPFKKQPRNHNVFGEGCDIYFPRFFHNAPGGPLVNHFYKNGDVYAAPLKDVEVDDQSVLRLKWWNGNNKLKAKRLKTKIGGPTAGYSPAIRFMNPELDLDKTHVLEARLQLSPDRLSSTGERGLYFDRGNGTGLCILFAHNAAMFGEVNADGSQLNILQTSKRDLDFGTSLSIRVVMKLDMMEVYVNDYLMNLKRGVWNGHIGLIAADKPEAFRQVELWQSI